MEKDLDLKLYNEYLLGDKNAFELLYNKYKSKIQYFIFNIVKDYQKAEDITQDVFIYILQNKVRQGYTFKYYIYLVAKSRSYNYINMENRKAEINEQYFSKERKQIEEDITNIITEQEKRKEILESINLLDDKYKNAVYLVNIEELSYKETAEILGESIQNIKNFVHRGKKELRKILIKKGFDEMNKPLKVILIIILVGALLSGVVYASIQIIGNSKGKAIISPTFTSKISLVDTNKVWVGTFNLVWNDFINDVIHGNVEFEDGYSSLADELNKQNFDVNQLNENSYYKVHGVTTLDLKNKIEKDLKQKFKENSSTILNNINWNNSNSYILYAILKKEFNYLEKFPTLNADTFGDSKEKVKYFGLRPDTIQDASKNVEVLFYNSDEDFAIKLKTQEGEEVYLYKTTGVEKTFEENYQEMIEKESTYTGKRDWQKEDILKIPFIQVNDVINYDELCGRYIKGTNAYIAQALQTVEFELNNFGGSVKSEALIEILRGGKSSNGRHFCLNDDFILYLKEEYKKQPYFALKVDDINVLELEN